MLKDRFRFFRWIFFLYVVSSTVFAVSSNMDKHTTKHINRKENNEIELVKKPYFYTNVSGGYGNFNGTLSNDGQTGILRLAIGTQFNFGRYTLFGTELGIQTGNRMRINSDNAIVAIGSAPVFLTVKPPIDALLTVAFHLRNTSLAILAKAGAVYCQGMMDSATISNKSKVMPEAQLGLSVGLSSELSLIVYYQRLFGTTPRLSNIDIDTGTATLNKLPTMQAGFIGIEKHF